MAKWADKITEFHQLITPDGVIYELHTVSKTGRWVLQSQGWGLPGIDYFTQRGPFQHGVSVRDFRLQPRTIQLLVRQQDCNRDAYWNMRTELLNAIRPNRDPIDLVGIWVARSQAGLNGQTNINSLVEFTNQLFGGTSPLGNLFRWDGFGQWTQVAGQLNAQTGILSLIVFDDGGGDTIYGGTAPLGRLFQWDGVATWVEVAAQFAADTDIYALVVYDDGLGGGDGIFGSTGPGGRLLKWNGVAAWVQVAAQLVAQTDIRSLVIYDDGGGDDIYGGTEPNGMLFRWNIGAPGNWVQVAPQLGAETIINSLAVYNGLLFGGTSPNGNLYLWNGVNAWTQVAPQFGAQTSIRSLVVYHGSLYGTTSPNGLLLRWINVANVWEQVAGQFVTESEVNSSLVFNNRLFGGSFNGAYLLEYIRRVGDTDLPCATLRRLLSDGSVRDLCVHIQKGPEFTPSTGRWDEWAFQELLRFWAPDPIIFDPAPQIGPTYAMGIGAINEIQTLTYIGTWQEHPTLIITGPLNNPIIRNEDIDEFIELDYNIPAGRIVTITLTPGSQTVVDDLGANLIGVVTPESNLQSFHLAPDPEVANGDNNIRITATASVGATAFVINYFRRYIGI